VSIIKTATCESPYCYQERESSLIPGFSLFGSLSSLLIYSHQPNKDGCEHKKKT
jgi:hypothetical protein